jgi:hypothetical protein
MSNSDQRYVHEPTASGSERRSGVVVTEMWPLDQGSALALTTFQSCA